MSVVKAARIVLFCVGFWTAAGAQTTLPARVQSDLLLLRIDAALAAGRGAEALEMIDSLAALGVEQPEGTVPLLEARAAMAADDLDRAETVLNGYLATAQPTSEGYRAALDTLSQVIDRRRASVTALLADADRARRQSNFDRAEALYTTVAAQAPRGSPEYASALRWLAELPALRASLAEQEARTRALAAEIEARAAETRRFARIEEDLYGSERTMGADMRRLRWILNSRYAANPMAAPGYVERPELTDLERDFLVRFRTDVGLLADAPEAGRRFVDFQLLRYVRAQDWVPLRADRSAATDLSTYQDWQVYRVVDPSAPGGSICFAMTDALALSPEDQYFHPMFGIAVYAQGADGQIMIRGFSFVRGSSVEMQIDERRFNLSVTENGLPDFFPENDNQAITVARAIRAGTEMTLTGRLGSLAEPATARFSLRGYTRAFRAMAELCRRPDALGWLD